MWFGTRKPFGFPDLVFSLVKTETSCILKGGRVGRPVIQLAVYDQKYTNININLNRSSIKPKKKPKNIQKIERSKNCNNKLKSVEIIPRKTTFYCLRRLKACEAASYSF